jgi:alpha-L-fucosidase
MRRILIVAMLSGPALSLLLPWVSAQEADYQPSEENLKAREAFQDEKFGLFIHWGIYSVLGQGEWVLHNKKMKLADYEKLAEQFNPTKYDPAEWVRLAREAGMKYITITSKHHDGFAMWDTKVSDWSITKRTPYKKDVLKMLADECHKQGVKLFFYHSHLDWYHPDYFPRGRTGQHTGRPEQGDFNKYLDFMDAQIAELCTNYGKIAGIWFDGWWDQQVDRKGKDPRQTKVDWRLRKTYDLIHRLQPQALVGNNHHVLPFPGEDFQMFERDLPGENKAGFNIAAKIGKLPLETCETINKSWGYNKTDNNHKSVAELIHLLVNAAGRNANLLLNVGPTPEGTIQPEHAQRLREVGQWLKTYGQAIYNTRGGPLEPQPWGVTTRSKDNKTIFVHILKGNTAEVPADLLAGRTVSLIGNGGVQAQSDGKLARITVMQDEATHPVRVVVLRPNNPSGK